MIPRRPAEPRRGDRGLPAADPLELRVARAVAIVASTWFALAAGWELFGPLLAGHYASSASMGIIAENMLRWHIPGPVWEYTTTRPGPDAYYCHHPWGIFWTTVPFVKLFGHHDFVCRMPPLLLSAITPPLLYAIGRAVWRPAAGAAAAAAFVVLPITLAFASFNALEVPVMAWGLLATWGFVRLTQTSRRRFLAVSVLGAVLAMNADWPAFVLVGTLLGFGLFRGLVLGPRWFGRVDTRRYAQWWALTASAAVLTAVAYLALFQKSGKLSDLLGTYGMRAAGNEASLGAVLASRRYWIELSFTPIAIALGKLAAPLALGRLVILRREHELLPLAWLALATVQYVVFKQGADIHVFWPQYFAAYFALAMGALVATLTPLASGAAGLVRRWRKRPAPARSWGWALSLGLALAASLAILRDGVPALVYARGTGGRFNEKGLLIHSDGAKTAFLHFLGPTLRPGVIVDMHEGMKTTWAQVWALGGRVVSPNRAPPKGPANDGRDAYLADTRFLYDEAQEDLVRRFHVVAVGPFWAITRSEPFAPVTGFAIEEREPSLLERYFVSGTEPHREITPDPFVTWELRVHFAQSATPPSEAPRTFEQKRIAHNVALAAGDHARAAALRAELEAELRPIQAAFDDGTRIVGAGYHAGARPLLTLLIEAGGPLEGDVQLAVRSRVVARAWLSTTMADPLEREVGIPLGLSPRRWKRGFLYADFVPIRKRAGTESFSASFVARSRANPPKRVGGERAVEVLRLE